MIRHLLLDWSGTLCDDQTLTLAATNDVLRHYGAGPVDEATYREQFRLPIEGFYQRHIGPVPREQIDTLFFERYAQRAGQSGLFPEVRTLLEVMRWRAVDVTIVSTMAQRILESLVTRLQIAPLLHAVYGGAADKVPVLRRLITAQGWDPDTCLYVGDMPHDIEAARAAGAQAGAALYGYCPPDKLRAAQPDRCYQSVGELLGDLEQELVLAVQRRVVPTVGGMVINEAGEVLLVRTRKWSDLYGLPGGKIQYGETMENAYYRELREETGLHLDNATWLTTQDCIEHPQFREPRHFLLINYLSRVAGRPALQANYESREIGWYPLQQIDSMALNEPTRALLRLARERGHV